MNDLPLPLSVERVVVHRDDMTTEDYFNTVSLIDESHCLVSRLRQMSEIYIHIDDMTRNDHFNTTKILNGYYRLVLRRKEDLDEIEKDY